MNKLATLSGQVLRILERYPASRENDDVLVAAVYMTYHGVRPGESFISVMKDRRMRGLPSTESIRRTRQKIQEQREDLRGGKRSEAVRMEAQKDYIEYASSDCAWKGESI